VQLSLILKLPKLQRLDPICKIIWNFIQNLDNPQANQEPSKSPKANVNINIIKYAQDSFIQDDIL